MREHAVWLIPALPLAGATLQALVGRRLGAVGGPLLGIAAMAGSFGLTLAALRALLAGAPPFHPAVEWLTVGDLRIGLGLELGRLQAAVLTMVTFASLLIQTYSIGYMRGDAKYNRFFTLVSLFTFGMILTVLTDNLLFLLVGWEIMGFCSYALIGHWFENPDNVRAAMKAFITTRVGDLGLFAAIFLLAREVGTLEIAGIREAVEGLGHGPAPAWVTLAALGLFWAAVGKSAQLPLHVWLPDAMAGPTPVSALIHAATMVAAGVYLVARHAFLFEASPLALSTVAYVGAATAVFAATVAVVQEDIKKVLAYSTMSQLGYMMMGLGVGAFAAGIFHLITHGFFKALLFLAAGSVIHALHHEQNLHRMGGLLGKLPVTAAAFLVGTLALAGIWPFSGFFSKDEILLATYQAHRPALFWLGIAGAALTAFYMTRCFVLAFLGRPRDRERHEHAHESPPVMTVPLLLLAVPSLLAGLPAAQRWLGPAVFGGEFGHRLEAHSVASPVPVLATGAALLGILAGLALFARPGAARLRRRLIDAAYPVYALLKHRFYIDDLYEAVFVRGALALASLAAWLDRVVIDGLVHGVAGTAVGLGALTRRATTGLVQSYMMAMFLGVLLGLVILQAMGG